MRYSSISVPNLMDTLYIFTRLNVDKDLDCTLKAMTCFLWAGRKFNWKTRYRYGEWNIHFICTTNLFQFLKCTLDKLPTILGFEGAKGFFAWRLANRCPTLKYRGKIPPPEDFGFDRMVDEKRVQFWRWYTPLEADPEFVYDLEKEAVDYCM